MNEDLKELLRVAEEDLKTAKELYTIKNYRYSSFFAQQSVEKFLKAYVLRKKGRYKFTHNTTKLILDTEEKETINFLFEIKADKLDRFYTGTRYPPLIEVSEEEAKEAIGISEKVREFILKKLGLWNINQ